MRTTSTLFIALLSLVACDKKTETPAAPKPVAGEPAKPAAAAPAKEMAATAPAPDKTAAPEMKLKETANDKIGTSPEGLGLKTATKAPDAKLLDISGKEVSLASAYAAGPTLVVFYRGGWCPFCNIQLHDLSEAKKQFDDKGIKLIAISVDLPSEEAKTQAKAGVAFSMLSDPKLVAHQAFNVVKSNSEEEIKALGGYGIELDKFSGEKHGKFAVPAVFLIDKTGTVRFAHVDSDYQTRPSPAQLLAASDKALASK